MYPIKQVVVTIVFLAIQCCLHCQILHLDWLKTIESDNRVAIRNILSDQKGNVFVIGSFVGRVDLDAGPGVVIKESKEPYNADIFISKYNANGNLSWIKTIGSSTWNAPDASCIDSQNNLFIAGSFAEAFDFDPGPQTHIVNSPNKGNGYILKLNSEGKFIWVKLIEGYIGGFTPRTISVQNNEIVMSGYFNGDFDFDPGPNVHRKNLTNWTDGFILKLTQDGIFKWVKILSTTGHQAFFTIFNHATDQNQNIWLVGYFDGKADFDPNTGVISKTAIDGRDVYILKLNGNGEYLWNTTYGANGWQSSHSIQVDEANNVVFALNGTTALMDLDPGPGVSITYNQAYPYTVNYIVKLDSSGNFIWAKTEGTGSCYDLKIDKENNIYTVGQYQGSIDNFKLIGDTISKNRLGHSNGYILKRKSNGKFIWNKSIGESDSTSVFVNTLNLINQREMAISGGYKYKLKARFSNRTDSSSLNLVGLQNNYFLKMSQYDCAEQPLLDTLGIICDTLISTEPFVDSLQWLECSNNYQVLKNDTQDTLIAKTKKTYAVEISRDYCVDTTQCFEIQEIVADNDFSFLAFPNPNSGDFNIRLSDFEDHNLLLQIYASNGTVVLERTIVGHCHKEIPIRAKSLSKGVYIIRITGENTSVSRKVSLSLD